MVPRPQQWPVWHCSPMLHAVPPEPAQPPQLFGSVVGSVQAPAHTTSPVGQVHAPLLHVAPVAHTLPHVMQLFGSLLRFVHTGGTSLRQAVFGELHVELHTPELQVWSDPHLLVHVPQLFGSVWRFTHEPPQLSWPLAQQMPLS